MKRTAVIALVVAAALPLAPVPAHASQAGSCGLGAWLMDHAGAVAHAEEHGFSTDGLSQHFAHLDRNGSGFVCASYAPTSSPKGALGHVNVTDDDSRSGIVSFRFTKDATGPGSLRFTGTYDGGAGSGTLTSSVEVLKAAQDVLHVRVSWDFGSFTTVQTGTLDLKDGDVALRGTVTSGASEGRRTVDTGHVRPDGSYLGVMSILPA